MLFDELGHAFGQAVQRVAVKRFENVFTGLREQGRIDLSVGGTATVQTRATQAEKHRLDGGRAAASVCAAARDEVDDLGRDAGGQHCRAGGLHGLDRLRPGHWQQPHPVAQQGGHLVLPALDFGKKVLAERQHDAIALCQQVVARQFRPLRGVSRKIGGNPVLDQICKTIEHVLDAVGAVATLGEEFLELVEDEYGREQEAVLAPDLQSLAVQVAPQVFAFVAGREICAGPKHFFFDPTHHLLQRRPLGVGRVVDTQIHRQEMFVAQFGHHPGLEQRTLAESGAAVQNRQGRKPYEAQ